MASEQEAVQADAKQLSQIAEITGIHCQEFTAKFNQDFDQDKDREFTSKASTTNAFRASDDCRLIDVRLAAEVVGFEGAELSEEAPPFFELRVVLDVRYVVRADAEPPTREAIKNFAETIGLFHAWPFLREALHAASTRIGITPVVLPLFRIKAQ